MQFVVFGVNYNHSSLKAREKLSVSCEKATLVLQSLKQQPWVDEVLILSTCNRTEFYIATPQCDKQSYIKWLVEYFKVESSITDMLYEFTNIDAIEHLLKVASGLDSMVQGETQILGQIKRSYSLAQQQDVIGKYLHHIVQQTINAAKEIRHVTDININATSLPYVTMKLAKRTFPDLEKIQIMLVGAGETNRLMAAYLNVIGVNNVIVANRSLARAKQILIGNISTAISLTNIQKYLPKIDIIIMATSSGCVLLDQADIKKARANSAKPLLCIDLAVPRNLDVSIGGLDNVTLYNMDDLEKIMHQTVSLKKKSVVQAQKLVSKHSLSIHGEMNQLDASLAISTYQKHADQVRNTLLQNAYGQIEKGHDYKVVLDNFSAKLSSHLAHDIYILLKQAAVSRNKEFIQRLNELINKHKDSASI